jgi:hypothetical protein
MPGSLTSPGPVPVPMSSPTPPPTVGWPPCEVEGAAEPARPVLLLLPSVAPPAGGGATTVDDDDADDEAAEGAGEGGPSNGWVTDETEDLRFLL